MTNTQLPSNLSAPSANDSIPSDIEPQPRSKGSDFSKPSIVRNIKLKTNQVQKVFEHCYKRANHALYTATKVAHDQNRVKDAKTAETRIKAIFETFSTELTDTAAQQQRILEEKVPPEYQTTLYDHQREYRVSAKTSFSMRLLNLTEVLDAVVTKIDALEINNVISFQESADIIESWIRRYRKFCGAIEAIKSHSLPARKKEPID